MDIRKKNPAREQPPSERITNFREVSLGYDEKTAVAEALRCLQCRHKPCVAGCPVNVPIPEFIQKIADGEHMRAYELIRETNALPAVCGRVCPQEVQCEAKCVRGIKGEPVGIGRLERFAADYAMQRGTPPVEVAPLNGKKVAVIGSGPAGLTCAGDLRMLGYAVTVFEALHMPGGVLVYGIPEFRLPKALVREEIASLEAMGVEIKTDMIVGRSVTLDELFTDEGYSAVFIGSGAGLPNFQGIPGENLIGVYSANEYLTRINLMRAYEFPNVDTPVRRGTRVAVIGGGNVAMDAARSAKRLGAEHVYVVYRRSEREMPARAEEVEHAKEEGIEFMMLTNPTRIIGDESGEARAMECVRMELGEPDASGRRRPIAVTGSEFLLDVDTVIVAIGNSPNPLLRDTTPGLKAHRWGGLVVNEETLETSREFVYAGGDAVTGAATVILAMGAGKRAAQAIHEKLSGGQPQAR
ncbi:MAG: NADPH-dependent glutamate synthase [Christensenellales bacterium]|jgi:glutamate synthase (NADPH/NADH) small chain